MNDDHRDQPQPFGGHISRLAGDSTPWWPEPVRPAQDSPNIIVVLLDDLGFSDIGPYGSEISTPTLDRLSAGGLRFTNYHTAPLCSPSRASIHTGMNPHRAGFAGVANFDPGFPGWTMEIDPSIDTLPRLLRNAGYATFAVGKWHLTRDGAMHDGAPRDSWPLQVGYDRFYGVLEGWTNLHHPHRLVRDNSPVAIDTYPDGYYFTDDITDEAISYLKSLRSHDSTRPFSCTWPTGRSTDRSRPRRATSPRIGAATSKGGTRSGSADSPIRSSRACSTRARRCRRATTRLATRWRLGPASPLRLKAGSRGTWRCTPRWSITSTRTWAACWLWSRRWATWTTRSSCSPPTTARPERAGPRGRGATTGSSETQQGSVATSTSSAIPISSAVLGRWCTTPGDGGWRRTRRFGSTSLLPTPAACGCP